HGGRRARIHLRGRGDPAAGREGRGRIPRTPSGCDSPRTHYRILSGVAGPRAGPGIFRPKGVCLKSKSIRLPFLPGSARRAALLATDIKIDLSKEQPGKPPATFEPIVGTWLVAQDGPDKVIMVDGRPWVAAKDNPTKLLVQTARKLYGINNEELMD